MCEKESLGAGLGLVAGVNQDDGWQCLPLIDYVLRRTASESETNAETQGQQRSPRLLRNQNGRVKSAISSSVQESRHMLQEAGIDPGDTLAEKRNTMRHEFSAKNHESSELVRHRRLTSALATSGGVNGLDEVVPSNMRRLTSPSGSPR